MSILLRQDCFLIFYRFIRNNPGGQKIQLFFQISNRAEVSVRPRDDHQFELHKSNQKGTVLYQDAFYIVLLAFAFLNQLPRIFRKDFVRILTLHYPQKLLWVEVIFSHQLRWYVLGITIRLSTFQAQLIDKLHQQSDNLQSSLVSTFFDYHSCSKCNQ